MQVSAFLADSVIVAGGALFAHAAGFHVVRAEREPVVVPRLGLGLVLETGAAAEDERVNVVIRLVTEAGDVCPIARTPVDGEEGPFETEQVEIALTLSHDDGAVVVLAVTLDTLTLPGAGRYRLQISAGEGAETSVPLRVIPA